MGPDNTKILIAQYDTWFEEKYRQILDEYVPERYTFVYDDYALVNEFKRGKGDYTLVIVDDTYNTGIRSIDQMRSVERDNKLTPVPMYLTRAGYRSVEGGDLPPEVTGILEKPLSEGDFMDLLYAFLEIDKSSPLHHDLAEETKQAF